MRAAGVLLVSWRTVRCRTDAEAEERREFRTPIRHAGSPKGTMNLQRNIRGLEGNIWRLEGGDGTS